MRSAATGLPLAAEGFADAKRRRPELAIVSDHDAMPKMFPYAAGDASALRRHANLKCFNFVATLSESPVADRGVGERGPLGPPEKKEQS